jgi:hypothetical protein
MSRTRITRCVGALLFGGAVLVAPVIGAGAAGSGVPQSLVGTWGKSVSDATWKKDHVFGEPNGHYALVIAPSGLVSMYHGNDPTMAKVSIPFTTMRAAASGNTVTFGSTADGACAGKGTYHWAASGSRLTFTLVKEGCDARKVLMTAGPFALEH